ncbi:hypothetical protein NicSoilB4_20840 [Arthrobacter sp. NicSoilB4]|uniref:nuclease-related domain-containing protein n=1 Tax=Arthrobacter sp. NicSoilB4 TaxID=2830997 RepID=UPI001CC386F5|nr:nuclease-related domain-containing protein [Arthrobacter sp. NicSoilB4]BCW67321.1 hypothetical protein NicSoilB4_20840 [Arthrobacter sp. NicSoilB4]
MTADPAPVLLGARVPAQAVMEELLALQSLERRRSRLQRIFGASPLSEATWPWYRGALGEIAVGRILAALGPAWLVLHAVPVGTGSTDIDHVLVGPPGVFTINTKNHSGQPIWVAGRTLMVAGKKTRHLYSAAHEAARASKLLSAAVGDAIAVTGVVVVVEPKTLTIKAAPEQVAVVTERQLLRWLMRRSHVLDPEQVSRIATAAVLARTWHRNPAQPGDAIAIQQNFAALRLLVDRARWRRATWVLGVPAIAFLMLVAGGPLGSAILHALTGR